MATKTQAKEKQTETKATTPVTPRSVLYEELIFYRDKANLLGNEIARILKEGNKSQGDLLYKLYKLMLDNKSMLIEIAAKLAPYEHAKLESVEVKATVEHRFVIRVPEKAKDTKAWLENCGQEVQAPILVDHKASTLSKAHVEDAIDPVDYVVTNKISRRSSRDDADDYVPPEDRFN